MEDAIKMQISDSAENTLFPSSLSRINKRCPFAMFSCPAESTLTYSRSAFALCKPSPWLSAGFPVHCDARPFLYKKREKRFRSSDSECLEAMWTLPQAPGEKASSKCNICPSFTSTDLTQYTWQWSLGCFLGQCWTGGGGLGFWKCHRLPCSPSACYARVREASPH